MSIHNAASTDNSVGSHAVHVAPDNQGEITCSDNQGYTWSQIDPNAAYPNPIEASILLLFSSGLKANLFEQIMGWMRSNDVNDILGECHYDDRLWGFAIRTAKTWRTSNREQWRDPVLALLFRMGSFDWEGEEKLMNQVKQAVRLGTATSVQIWNRVLEIQERVSLVPWSQLRFLVDETIARCLGTRVASKCDRCHWCLQSYRSELVRIGGSNQFGRTQVEGA